jgi:hypothetical protein
MMRVRFFGDPWPNEERRAPICEDDRFRVPVEDVAGNKCLECQEVIKLGQRGVITACGMRIWGHFWLEFNSVPEDEGDVSGQPVKAPVAAYHLGCWLREVVGGVMSERIQERMHLRPGDVPLTPAEVDELEEQGLSVGLEDAEEGSGWYR